MSCGKSTHKSFYTQTLLHMVLLHKHTLTHRRFDTQKPLHTKAFTHRRFYTQTLLHTKAFTHKRFYTWCFYTNTLWHTDALTHKSLYTQTLLHTDALTHKRFLHTDAFTRRCFLHTHTRFHTDTFTNAFSHRRFWRHNVHFVRHDWPSVNRNFSSVFDVQRPFRAKGLRLTK